MRGAVVIGLRNGGEQGLLTAWSAWLFFSGGEFPTAAGLKRSLNLFALVVNPDQPNKYAADGEPLGRAQTSRFGA